jgi:hypothetical protein
MTSDVRHISTVTVKDNLMYSLFLVSNDEGYRGYTAWVVGKRPHNRC